jgi:imidazolonepropionase-like amidohydrolase
MAMIPTLKMFATTVTTKPSYIDPIHAVVRRFRALGGEILFGTDIGYMTDYATDDELAALADCGLSSRDILRALTTAPAGRFGVLAERGTVEPGRVADLVVLPTDPARDITAFAHPLATIRGGRTIFERTR